MNSVKKLLLLSALVFVGQLCAAESVPANASGEKVLEVSLDEKSDLSLVTSVLNSGKDSGQDKASAETEPAPVVESLDEILELLRQSSITEDALNAILMAVENMKKNHVSDESMIKFIRTMMSKKAKVKHSQLEMLAYVVAAAALVAGGVCVWKLYQTNKTCQELSVQKATLTQQNTTLTTEKIALQERPTAQQLTAAEQTTAEAIAAAGQANVQAQAAVQAQLQVLQAQVVQVMANNQAKADCLVQMRTALTGKDIELKPNHEGSAAECLSNVVLALGGHVYYVNADGSRFGEVGRPAGVAAIPDVSTL